MSDTEISRSGSPTPALSFATGDGASIAGAGVAAQPLSTGGYVGGPFSRRVAGDIPAPPEVAASPFVADGAIRAGAPIYMSAAGLLAEATDDTHDHATVIGLSPIASADGAPAVALSSGCQLTLPIAAWDALVGGGAGLTPGKAYYLGIAGAMTTVAGTTWLGVALSATTMLVLLGPPTAAS
jgi:hypothetical protein